MRLLLLLRDLFDLPRIGKDSSPVWKEEGVTRLKALKQLTRTEEEQKCC